MAGINKLEDLVIWQLAMDLCEETYKITKKFPKDELYSLVQQVRRAAVSVSSNIAEGFGRRSRKEFKHFLSIALGSLSELKTQIRIAKRIEYIDSSISDEFIKNSDALGRQINAFYQKVN